MSAKSTGLRDTNGKIIKLGNTLKIVHHAEMPLKKQTFIRKVFFQKGCFWTKYIIDKMEYIGNPLFVELENPNLITLEVI